MKRINNKGFMLAEIIIVSVVLATAMVGLFATFSKMFLEYEKRSNYQSVDAIYFSKIMAKAYLGDNSSNVNIKLYSHSLEFFKKYNVVQSFKIECKKSAIDALLSHPDLENNSIKYKEYLEYLKNNVNFNSEKCDYLFITEVSDNCDSSGCYEDNANVGFGSYIYTLE